MRTNALFLEHQPSSLGKWALHTNKKNEFSFAHTPPTAKQAPAYKPAAVEDNILRFPTLVRFDGFESLACSVWIDVLVDSHVMLSRGVEMVVSSYVT